MSEAGTCVLGLDFGTSAVRALIVDARAGEPLAAASWDYRRGEGGVVTRAGDALLARQHPVDHLEGLQAATHLALDAARAVPGFRPDHVRAVGVDTTGSTPLPVDRRLTPLALHPEFADDPDAMVWLWKDHTAHDEADRITRVARDSRPTLLASCGGTYSSEWFWSKAWRCRRVNGRVADAAHAWIELCDFIPAHLCGVTDPSAAVRSICAAAHKAMYHPAWGGLPDAAFLAQLDPWLARLRESFAHPALPADRRAGTLAPAAAQRLGLTPGIPVSVGALDAHLGAVGSGCAPGTLVKIIGTSTCDCTVTPIDRPLADIPGVCGVAPESILPGHHGIEAGQSAVGDIFNWFVARFAAGEAPAAAHERLTRDAARLAPGESGLLTLDWHNGNRNVLADPRLTGVTVGQTLATTPAEVYRSLIEGTAFGARVILERMAHFGVPIDRVVCCGGIAERNPLLLRIYADVLRRPMHVARRGDLACALGAAIMASVAAGLHPDVRAAQAAMTAWHHDAHRPDPRAADAYDRLFALYRLLHDAFGTPTFTGSLHGVMKELIGIKASTRR